MYSDQVSRVWPYSGTAQLLSFSPTWFSHSLTGLPMPFG